MKRLYLFVAILLSVHAANAQITLVKDIWQGSSSSEPVCMIEFNDKLYFLADDGIHGSELWCHNPAFDSTYLVYDIIPGTQSGIHGSTYLDFPFAVPVKGKLYFAGEDDTHGVELWSYDETGPPMLVADIRSGAGSSHPANFCVLNDIVYFTALGTTAQMYAYDPSTGLCGAVTNMDPQYYWNQFVGPKVAFNDKVYFVMADTGNGYRLFGFDPIDSSLTTIDVFPGPDGGIANYRYVDSNALYFYAESWQSGTQNIYMYNGVDTPVKITNGLPPVSEMDVDVLNNKIYLNAGASELYSVDLVTHQWQLESDICPGPCNGQPYFIAIYNGKVYFSASNGSCCGHETYSYDGTNSPTMIQDLNSGWDGGGFTFPKIVGGTLYFGADDGIHGRELFKLEAPVGVGEVEKDLDISCYPIPTFDKATIKVKLPNQGAFAVSVYDVLGKRIQMVPMQNYTQGNSEISISLKDVVAGTYHYNLVNKEGEVIASGRMVKQ
jgi:ELWxxDGT repeat protein